MAAEPNQVLFVTSDPVLAAVYRLKLELDEYRITWAEPLAALGELSVVKPDLLYVDVDSPGVTRPLLLALRRARAGAGAPMLVITRRPEDLVRASLPPALEPFFVLSLAHPEGVAV